MDRRPALAFISEYISILRIRIVKCNESYLNYIEAYCLRTSIFVFSSSIVLAACATSPDKMVAADVSTLKYQDYNCKQVTMESDRIGRRVNTLYEQLNRDAKNDAWQMGVGLVLLWPILFALEGGDGPEAVEYRQLKGEYGALESVAIAKKCGIQFKDFDAELKAKAEQDSKNRKTDFPDNPQ